MREPSEDGSSESLLEILVSVLMIRVLFNLFFGGAGGARAAQDAGCRPRRVLTFSAQALGSGGHGVALSLPKEATVDEFDAGDNGKSTRAAPWALPLEDRAFF